ncbi:MAG: sulfatase [Kofleriaceae bacterium]
MSRARVALRLVSASLAAAAVGSAVAGAADAAGVDGGLELVTATGLAMMPGWPLAALAMIVLVTLTWAWQPAAVATAVREPGGGAPRLAAWLLFLGLAGLTLAAATFASVNVQARLTAFKPGAVAIGTAGLTLAAALGLVVVSRPVVTLLAAGLRRLDGAWQRRRGRPLLTPARIVVAAGATVATATVLIWFVLVQPGLALYELAAPRFLAVLAGATLAAALGLRRLPSRTRGFVGGGACVLALATIAIAVWALLARPLVVLRVWNREAIASDAIERLVDLDALRGALRVPVARPVPRPGAEHPSVILITIDTVRADRTPLLDGPAKMPTLARLGTTGAVFTRAYAPGNVTRRSIPSMITGLSPPRVRGRVAGWALRLDPRHVTLAERFRAAGYDTAGFFCCASFWAPRHKLGINRGIDELVVEPDGGAKLAERAAAWLRTRADDPTPYFLWLHFIEPHRWNTTTFDDEEAGVGKPKSKLARYDRMLAEVDTFLTTLAEAMPPQAPIVAITSDHGEGLGEHGAPYHSTNLYESQLHVPLLITGPGVPASKIAEPVGLVDLAPTLLDLAGFEPPGMPAMDGRSLAALATGRRPPDPDGGGAYAVMVADRSVPNTARAIVVGRWKLIVSGDKRELYDVLADRNESRNRASVEPDVVTALEARLAERMEIDLVSPMVGWD